MKRIQSTALLRLVSSSLRLSLAAGVLGVFASVGFAAGASKDTYYVNDHLASTVATSDASGEIAQIESDAFGSQDGAVAKDSRYTGKPYDADMGAYVFPFRNYRSDEARWMSADPSGFPDGMNGNVLTTNVLSQVDPWGLNSKTISAGSFAFSINYTINTPSDGSNPTLQSYDVGGFSSINVILLSYTISIGSGSISGITHTDTTPDSSGNYTRNFSGSFDATVSLSAVLGADIPGIGKFGFIYNKSVAVTDTWTSSANLHKE